MSRCAAVGGIARVFAADWLERVSRGWACGGVAVGWGIVSQWPARLAAVRRRPLRRVGRCGGSLRRLSRCGGGSVGAAVSRVGQPKSMT
jgi:hypothetical protein